MLGDAYAGADLAKRQMTPTPSLNDYDNLTPTHASTQQLEISMTSEPEVPSIAQYVREQMTTETSATPSYSAYPTRQETTTTTRRTRVTSSQAQPKQSAPVKPSVFRASGSQGMWQPSTARLPLKVTSAPQNVKVEHNFDQSVTMSFGLAPPPPRADVNKENFISPTTVHTIASAKPVPSHPTPEHLMPTNTRPGCWHPSFIPDVPDRPLDQSPLEPMSVQEKYPKLVESEPSHFPFWEQWAREEPETLAKFTYEHLMRILNDPSGEFESNVDPSIRPFLRKKSKTHYFLLTLVLSGNLRC